MRNMMFAARPPSSRASGAGPAGLLLAWLLVSSTIAMGSRPQEAGQTQPVTRLDLKVDNTTAGAQVTGTPGGQITLILVLSAPTGRPIGSAVSQVHFPGSILSFREARDGLSALAVDAEVRAAAKEQAGDGGESLLEVTVSSREGKAIPNGILAELVFEVSADAADGMITLKNVARAFTPDEPPGAVEPVSGNQEMVQISKTALFACFFYMH